MQKASARALAGTLWLYPVAIALAAVYVFLLDNPADLDLWGKLSIGALLERDWPIFPHVDPFSYTAPRSAWVDHEWGAGVVFYACARTFGSASLLLLKIVLFSGTLGIACACHAESLRLLLSERQRRNAWVLFVISALVLVPLALPGYRSTLRSQLFTNLAYALFLWGLVRHQRGRSRALLGLPPIMLLWVNTHGGVILGFFALASYALGHLVSRDWTRFGHLAAISFVCLAATFVNPYGVDYHREIIAAWAMSREHVAEWGTVFRAGTGYGALYTAALLLWTALALAAWPRGRRCLPPAILIAATGLEGWLHYKLVPIFSLTVFCLGASLAPSWSPFVAVGRRHGSGLRWAFGRVVPIALASTLGLSVLWQLNHVETLRVKVEDRRSDGLSYPIGAVEFIRRQGLEGNLWSTFGWGQFLFWCLTPSVQVSLDGRYEAVYPDAVVDDHLAFFHPPYDLARARRYPTHYALVPTRNGSLVDKLTASPDWHEIYRDDVAVLFEVEPSDRAGADPAPDLRSHTSRTLDDYLSGPPIRLLAP